METKDFETSIKDWEWQWVNKRKDYEAKSRGDAVTVSKQLYTKYRKLIEAIN